MTYYARPAWRNQWLAVTLASLLLMFFTGAAMYVSLTDSDSMSEIGIQAAGVLMFAFWVPVFYRRYSWRFTIDEENIESRHGIIARELKSIRIEDLRNINVTQSVFQRLFGIGDIEFSSAAGGGVEVVFKGVIDPISVKEIAQDLQEQADQGGHRD